jgi:hypothetical protein
MTEVDLPFYACTAGVGRKRARCRENAIPGSSRCPEHVEGPDAPEPDRIVWRIKIRPDEAEKLEELGLPRFERSPEARKVLEARRVETARELGRDPSSARAQGEGPDDGSPVFGKERLPNADLSGLFRELYAKKFRFVSVHVLDDSKQIPHGPKVRSIYVVIELARDTQELEASVARALKSEIEADRVWAKTAQQCIDAVKPIVRAFIEALVRTSFGVIDVWANPRDRFDKVVHTVTCRGERKPLDQARYRLRYADGLWAV